MKIVGRLTNENEKARTLKQLINPPEDGSMAALSEDYLFDDAGFFHVEV